jgi:hypothetical protein
MDAVGSDSERLTRLLREAAGALRSVTCSPTDRARKLASARDALDAHLADALAEVDASGGHLGEGCASVATWAAREFRQDVGMTRQMVRAAKTMRELPTVGASARAGFVSLEHIHALTYALKHCDRNQVIANEADLRVLAEGMKPRELFQNMRVQRAVINPDELDDAYLRGMDKADIQCHRLPDGFHVTGHLPTDVGAKFKVFLAAVSVPRDAADLRTNAERRVDGFDELLTRTLESGLPSDGGVRPHVAVRVEAETLKDVLNQNIRQRRFDLEAEPATLEGFGPIGPALLAYLAFGGNVTPILVAEFKENPKILDAGPNTRFATRKQGAIVRWRQKGRCANRGCHHPIGEIHHVLAWADGGRTKLDNLAGLCRKCHAMVTIGQADDDRHPRDRLHLHDQQSRPTRPDGMSHRFGHRRLLRSPLILEPLGNIGRAGVVGDKWCAPQWVST